jgi:hypothetical protein
MADVIILGVLRHLFLDLPSPSLHAPDNHASYRDLRKRQSFSFYKHDADLYAAALNQNNLYEMETERKIYITLYPEIKS